MIPRKCKRDTRYNLQGVDGNGGMLYDLRYGGNSPNKISLQVSIGLTVIPD